MTVKHVGIVGAGTMGNGIAQAFAVAGVPVTMTDIGEAQLQRGLKSVDGSLERLVNKEKMSAADKAAALARIQTSTSLDALRDADLVIEAATENLDLKLEIFGRIDQAAKADAVIATNTSSISITRLAAATKRPDKVIGCTSSTRVPVMQLVELIKGLQTSDATYAAAEAIAKKIGKAPVQGEELARIRGEPHALPDDQRGGLRARRRPCDRGRDRRGDEARLQSPDRPARALRPDRARRRARGDAGAVRGLQGPEVPSRAAARRDGRGGVPGAQDRARVSRV